ncbi:MAG: hypothetical protein ACJ8BW_29625 [Ktedonobacteraceae bacterium]
MSSEFKPSTSPFDTTAAITLFLNAWRRGRNLEERALSPQKGESIVDEMPKRIDVHHHIVPKEYVESLSKNCARTLKMESTLSKKETIED